MKTKFLHRWSSLCSAHLEHQEGCQPCDTGRWIFVPAWWIGSVVFRVSPRLWRWWANRGDVRKRFKMQWRSRRTGRGVDAFPNL